MIAKTSTVSSSRIYIPKKIRDQFNINDGDTLIWSIEDNNKIVLLTQTKGKKPERFKVNRF